MNPYLGFLAAVLDGGELTPLRYIKPEWFLKQEFRQPLDFILSFAKEYHAIPSRAVVAEKFPDIALPEGAEVPKYHADEIRKRAVNKRIGQLLKAEVAVRMEQDANFNALSALQDVTVRVTQEFALIGEGRGAEHEGAKDRWKAYLEREENKGLMGLPFPWESYNRASSGMLGGDLWVLFGRSGRNKTWYAMVLAEYLVSLGYKVLFASLEWRPDRLMLRTDAIAAKVSALRYLRGELEEEERTRMQAHLVKVHRRLYPERGEYHFRSRAAVPDLFHLNIALQEVQPDIAFVDAAYMLGGSRKWDVQASLADGLKEVADARDIPIWAIVQANRNRKGYQVGDTDQGDVGGTAAWEQNADGQIALSQSKEMEQNSELLAEGLKIRMGLPLGDHAHRWDLHEMDFREIPLASVSDYDGPDIGDPHDLERLDDPSFQDDGSNTPPAAGAAADAPVADDERVF